MKKIILLLLTFSLILSLFSCTMPPETALTSDTNTESSKSDYTESPFDFVLVSVDSILYRLYPEEGMLIPACVDPLCKHSEGSCPLTKVGGLIISGDIIYYTRFIDTRGVYQNRICSYNLFTGDYKVLYKADSSAESILYLTQAENYLFFNQHNPMLSIDNRRICIMRYDLDSGKAVVLAEGLPDTVSPSAAKDGRMYWYGAKTNYSTDFDYKDKRENDYGVSELYSSGGYQLKTVITKEIIGSSGNRFPEKKIYRVDIETKEESVIVESTGTSPILYKEKVIYTRDEEAVLIGKGYDDYKKKEYKIYDKFGSKLYICNIDGSEDRLLCDISGNYCALDHGSGAIGYKGSGDYVIRRVWSYQPIKDKPELIERGADKFLIINIVTGEYKIVGAE
ncbi:MAG: hypothetical protein E7665_01450 [Ruminococcaceae bacterium]|nr:hypothetical protein [Oscillospiraceae bacterium]